MRDFFVNALEKLVAVIIVLLGLAVVGIAGFLAFGPPLGRGAPSGPMIGLLILVVGAVWVILIGGFMYLGIGTYQNTKRSANALEKLASR